MNKFHLSIHFRSILVTLLFFLFLNIVNAQVQTQTKKIVNITSYIRGFLESLPVDYAVNTSKKYPLIIFWHGSGETGTAPIDTALGKVATLALPKYIRDGQFPSSFTVDGESHSFIVLSPQYTSYTGSASFFPAMVSYAVANYRVDPTRIYITGLSLGGLMSFNRISNSTTFCDSTAAEVLVCPGQLDASNTPSAAKVATPAAANVPIWGLNNNGDTEARPDSLISLQNYYNAYTPTPDPRMKVTILQKTGHDAWTTSYNPDSSWGGLNVYQWLLQYTNEKLVAKAGPDQTFTAAPASVTLDGSKSHARKGRITNYSWAKIAGPSSGTLTPVNNGDTTIITGLTLAGTYSYSLTVTHTDGTTKKDTVNIIINSAQQIQTKRTKVIYREVSDNSLSVGGYLESLPVSYDSVPTKKFPLIIYIHREGSYGTGSQAALDTLVNETGGIPDLIKNGNFPSSVTVDGKTFSFIVISPQFTRGEGGISLAACTKAMIDTAVKYYRVDTTRIYVTGSSWGGYAGNSFFSNNKVSYTNQTAASALICPLYLTPGTFTTRAAQVGTANLPLWFFGNSGDPNTSAVPGNLKLYVDTLNLRSPQLSDTAIRTVFSASVHDAWTAAYNPANTWNGLNVYQWMLQYTNDILIANAGPDQTFASVPASVTLDGSKSRARQGRIAGYSWTKLSGPSGGTLTPVGNGRTATLSGASAGVYSYKLTVTHDNASVKADTVNITINSTAVPPTASGWGGTITLPTSSITLSAVPSQPAPGSSITAYLWRHISGPATPTIVSPANKITSVTGLTTAGVYIFRIIVTDANGLSDSANVQVNVNAGSPRTSAGDANGNAVADETLTSVLDFKVSPNPVHSGFSIAISGAAGGKANILVYSTDGKTVLQQAFMKAKGETINKYINLSRVTGGVYTVRVMVGSMYIKSMRIVKQ